MPRAPVDIASDDLEEAARLAVKNDVFGNAVGKLRPAITKAIGDFVNPLVELDRDIETFVGKHAPMFRNPDRHVEIVSRHRCENELLHLG